MSAMAADWHFVLGRWNLRRTAKGLSSFSVANAASEAHSPPKLPELIDFPGFEVKFVASQLQDCQALPCCWNARRSICMHLETLTR